MNPELQRNLWLEASSRRIVWAVVVQAVIYGATLAITNQSTDALAAVGVIVFGVAALIWGPRAAGRAIGGEVAMRTWDFQRLSALKPWTMTWGKLAGATSLSWLVAGVGLAIAFAEMFVKSRDPGQAVAWLVLIVAFAVLMQAGAMALALVGVRRARAEGRLATLRLTPGTLVGVMVVMWALQHVAPFGRPIGVVGLGSLLPGFGGDGGRIEWWGLVLGKTWFAALSASVFAGWAVLASWRLMRLELQMRNSPWTWGCFVVFAALYGAGFVFSTGLSEMFAVAGAVSAACAYAAAFAEPADRVGIRLFVDALVRMDIRRIWAELPPVIGPVKMAAFCAVGLAVVATPPLAPALQTEWRLMGFAALAFLLRDLGVIASFRFGPRPGRGDLGAVLGLFLLYFAGGLAGKSLLGAEGGAIFMPTFGSLGSSLAPVSLASGLVQAAAVWFLAWSRIRKPEVSA